MLTHTRGLFPSLPSYTSCPGHQLRRILKACGAGLFRNTENYWGPQLNRTGSTASTCRARTGIVELLGAMDAYLVLILFSITVLIFSLTATAEDGVLLQVGVLV